MPIHLDSISVKNLGPVESLELTFGTLNLIYGKNESGKTYLVEFMLQSLFRQSATWKLRKIPGKGRISVAGLGKTNTNFSPNTNKKIEDYWDENELGLPVNMSRLLVVKGGELDLDHSPGGVNRDVLKTALTNEDLIDSIRNTISKTVQSANILNHEIVGANRGVLKDREDLRLEIQKIHGLLIRVEEEYSLGPIREIELEIDRVNQAFEQQESAKKSQAYHLRRELNDKMRELNQISDNTLDEIRDHLHDYIRVIESLQELEKNLAAHQEKSQDYPWLEAAIVTWEKHNLESKEKPSRWIIYLALTILALGLILLGINNMIPGVDLHWGGIALASVSGGINLYYLLRLQRWISEIHKTEEKESILLEYKSKFGTTAGSLSSLQEKLKSLQKSYYQLEPLSTSIQEQESIRSKHKTQIISGLKALTGKSHSEEDWDEIYRLLKNKSDELKDSIQVLEIELQKLDVPQDLEIAEQTAVEFDPKQSKALSQKLVKLSEELAELQHQLFSLKQLICHQTGDVISIPWQEALYHLRTIYLEKQKQYRQLTARLVAEIGIVQVLDLIERDEDLKLQNDINSPEVVSLLKDLTGRYHSLELIDNQLYAIDQFSRYPLSDLSTGAQEQILLGLRIGIASQLTGGDPLFMLLDDAFQHSDWDRREVLVKSIIQLAIKGWQIIYLTMDDHIRDLIIKLGTPALQSKFEFTELN